MPSCVSDDVDKFVENLPQYDAIFYKSLARNDHQWADKKKSHQSGVLIPRETLRFFGIEKVPEENTLYKLTVNWFLNGRIYHRSDMKHTGGKDKTRLWYYCEGNRETRPESHLTCVYNPYFEDLHDGALLIIGRRNQEDDTEYDACIIDTPRQKLIQEVIDYTEIPEGPSWGVIKKEVGPDGLGRDLYEEICALANEIYRQDGLPSTDTTSSGVWDFIVHDSHYIREHVKCPGLAQSKSPFQTALKNAPGNLTRWLLQTLEFRLLRVIEKLHYTKLFINEISSACGKKPPNEWAALEEVFAETLEEIVKVSKSLMQSRRSRAGNSFERHIRQLLKRNNISFIEQAGDRKMDFEIETPHGPLALSAKTSMRERWKQVYEKSHFITLERSISPRKLQKIQERDITLVVPEREKDEIDLYKESDKVLDFQTFLRRLS